jgi:NADH-quinone oxidoreductase subunit N
VSSGLHVRGSRFWVAATLLPFIGWLLWDFRQVPQSLFGSALEVNTASRAVGAAVGIFALLASFLNDKRRSERGEWAPLLLIVVLGMAWLPCARNWTSFFVYMETFAIASYVLVSLEPGRESSLEAGMKYLLLGAFSSAILLMGIAFLFGAFGQLDFDAIRAAIPSLSAERLFYAETGAGLVVVGLCFKAALAPFHMWAPDVYQGAPLPAAAFLAAASKLCVLVSAAVALEKSGLREIGSTQQLLVVVGAISVVA